MRTVVIGDVHGCLDELQRLVERCGVVRGDRVVLVGDLVAKGPDSQGVVQYLRERGYLAVLGNHDAHVLRLRSEGPGEEEAAEARARAGPEDADARGLGVPRGAPALPRAARARGAVVVHGGLVPGVPLEQQQREHLITMRSLTRRRRALEADRGRRALGVASGRDPRTRCSATTPCAGCSSTASPPASTPAASTAASSPRSRSPSGRSPQVDAKRAYTPMRE